MEFSLLPFLIESLGYNKLIYSDIDKLYQTDKLKFYNSAKNHELYNHPIIKEGGLLQEEYSKKALGLVLNSEPGGYIENDLTEILIKGWKYVYVFIKNKNTIDLDKFGKSFIKKNKGIDNVSIDCFNTSLLIAYFLATGLNKTIIENDVYKKLIEMFTNRWKFYTYGLDRISISKVSELSKLKIDKLKKDLSFWDLESLASKKLSLDEFPVLLYDFERISSVSIFDSIRLTKKDLDEILYACVVKENVIQNTDQTELIVSILMYLKGMIKAYKQIKGHYFQNNKETMFFEFEGIEKELSNIKDELVYKSNMLLEAEKTTKQQEKEIKRLKQEVAISYQEKLELHALRQFLFNLDKEEEYIQQGKQRKDLSKIKAVILGGHEKWQTKMKELLPNFVFIHPDNVNFSKEIIENTDYLFVYANYLNHAIYYRAMGLVKDAKICFLQQINEELVLDEIEKQL